MKVLLIIAGILVAGYLAVSAFSFYALKLNRITVPATTDPVVAKPVPGPAELTIAVIDGPAYEVNGERYDLAALKKLLTKDGPPVQAVVVRVLVENGFAPTVALIDELRRLGINQLRLEEQPMQPAQPAPTSQGG